MVFQSTRADIRKLYLQLRTLIFALASRFLSPRFIKVSEQINGFRQCEVEMMQQAIISKHNFLPYDRVDFGINFQKLVSSPTHGISKQQLVEVQANCANFLLNLTKRLLEKLPNNLETIQKLRFITPTAALTYRNRPKFDELPFNLEAADIDLIESQWRALGMLILSDINPEFTEDVDAVTLWGCVRHLSNAIGRNPFKELAEFVLKALTLPVSNAVVERIFSVMNAVKTKFRNRMQLNLLQAIIRIRIHMKHVSKQCCLDFEPTADMLRRFTKQMYDQKQKLTTAAPLDIDSTLVDDLLEMITLFAEDEDKVCDLV